MQDIGLKMSFEYPHLLRTIFQWCTKNIHNTILIVIAQQHIIAQGRERARNSGA